MTIESTEPCVRGLRLALVSAGALLESLRLIKAGEGNLSARVSSSRCLITPAGRDKGRLDPSDLVIIDVDGLEIPPTASSEARLHTTAYSRFPHVAAVVHAHPPKVQVLAGAGRVPECDLLLEGQQLLSRVGGVGPMEPGSQELADAVAEVLSDTQACVLDRHGAVTVGRTVDEAMRRMLLFERVANLTVASLGR